MNDNNELTIDEKIETLLLFYGIKYRINIEEEVKPMILLALSQDDVETVEIDDEGGLVITYSGTNNESSTI